MGMGIGSGSSRAGERLDPGKDRWLRDHCPTFVVPALPLMSMVDRIAAAASDGRKVIGLDRVEVKRWLPVARPVELCTSIDSVDGDLVTVTLSAWREARRAELSRFEPVAVGRVRLAAAYPERPAALPAPRDAALVESPYANGRLFHGPAFHKMRRLAVTSNGASAIVDADPGAVPFGALNQVLLDAATHAIAHDDLRAWSDRIGDDVVAYPHRVDDLRLYGPPPRRGELRCEVRFAGFDRDSDRHPMFDVQLIDGDEVWLTFRLVEVLLPKGPLGRAPAPVRRAFLRDRRPAPLGLSRVEDGATRLSQAEVRASDWLPGTIAAIYGGDDPAAIAVQDHVARLGAVHPSTVAPGPGATSSALPITRWPLAITREGDDAVVRAAADPAMDLSEVRAFWERYFAIGRWPMEDLCYGLAERFLRRVHVADPEAWAAVRGRSVLYLANHQVGIESLLFSIIVSGLSNVVTVTLAKAEHETSWLGRFIQHGFAYPGVTDPRVITYFDRADPESLAAIIADLGRKMAQGGKSVMVHVEGTRSLSCRVPVQKMSSAFIDMALTVRAPIVPVRFAGALPIDPLAARLEFPVGMGRQDIYLGEPIHPETFEALPYKERKPLVIDAINALGPANAAETPLSPDPDFAAAVAARARRSGAIEEHATLLEMLTRLADPSEPIAALVRGAAEGRLDPPPTPEGRWLAELARRLYGRD